ncbi:hypothetical protein GCM10009846_26500 [Agrococcus versicolor]|uniref:Uncharacterized protein n=1 Tax=Agrococcus versicolor TaxID=501482 RepID=A0ABN3AWD2_9MICO
MKTLDIPLSTGPVRPDSDEHYVLTLCEQIIGLRSLRQYAFDWLRADPDARGSRRRLPVDAYWPERSLVAQYFEGAIRPLAEIEGEALSDRTRQRLAYDERRRTQLALYGIQLVEISSEQLAHRRTRLLRDDVHDRIVLEPILTAAMP